MTDDDRETWVEAMREAEELAEEHEVALHLVARFFFEAYPGIIQPVLSLDEWSLLNKALHRDA